MEIINKKHEEIFANERVKLESYIKFDNLKSIYFSAGAGREFGLQSGLNVHFINDEDVWLMYANNEPDGFALIEREDKNATLLCNAALIQLFLKRTGCALPCKFLLVATKAKHQGNHLIKIDLSKPVK